MFCPKCGHAISGNGPFCSNCGTPLQAAVSQPQPRKNKKVILGAAIAGFAVVLLLVVGLIVIGSQPAKLTEKLSDTIWYSAPVSFVAVSTGEAFDAAYSIEFLDDGTAIMTSYACYGTKGNYSRVKIVERKSVEWSVEQFSVMELNDEEYSYDFFGKGEGSEMWRLEEDRLELGKTYYPDDEWGYADRK